MYHHHIIEDEKPNKETAIDFIERNVLLEELKIYAPDAYEKQEFRGKLILMGN